MFDPVHERESQHSEFGYRFYLEGDIDESRQENALNVRGTSTINQGLQCLFVGLEEPGRQLLELAERLIAEAIATGEAERRGDYHDELMTGYHSLALCRWALNGRDDEESLAKEVEHSKLYWAEQTIKRDAETLDIELPGYLNAGDPAYVIEVAEASRKVKEPKSLNTVRSPRVMAYLLAKHQLAGNEVGEPLHKASEKFLDRSIDEMFLDRGLANEAALWLKIVYWNNTDDGLSPRDVLRKAYDHMPQVAAPV